MRHITVGEYQHFGPANDRVSNAKNPRANLFLYGKKNNVGPVSDWISQAWGLLPTKTSFPEVGFGSYCSMLE